MEKDKTDFAKEKEEVMIKGVISRLSFVRQDMNFIAGLDLKPEIRKIVSEIQSKVELLFDKLLGRK